MFMTWYLMSTEETSPFKSEMYRIMGRLCLQADEAVDRKCLPCRQEVTCVNGLLSVRSEQEA
jgi:hypothetical protein